MRDTPAYAFTAIENFRDFGGAPGLGGRMIRTGRLFRAAHQGQASDADLEALKALGIGVIVDLRRPTERRHQPSRRWPGFDGRVIESELGDREEGPHLEFLRSGDLSDAGVEAYLVGYYRQAFFQPQHLELFAAAFEALDEVDAAMLIHCTAGKDRTGLLAGLIQRALGGAAQDIMDDFMETNRVTMTEARLTGATTRLEASVGRRPTPAILRGFLGVSANHLDAAFESLEREAGGLDGYLARIGVDAQRLERIRARLLV